jgi:DNA repair exonuclease SbcCD ATPase subunit
MKMMSVEGEDLFVFSEFKVELCNQGLVFVCADNRDSAGATSNGAGKTTIFKVVTYVLFGECVDGDKGDQAIRRGAKKGWGKITISDGDTIYYITRFISKGKPRLKMEWEVSGEPGVINNFDENRKELQARIVDLIGLDFHAFKNTVLYGANDIVKFADPRTKDAERKRMLHCILRTSVLQECHKKALERGRAVKASIDDISHKMDNIQVAIDSLGVKALKLRRDEWSERQKGKVSTERGAADRIKFDASKLSGTDYTADIEEVEAKIAKLTKARRKAAKKAAGTTCVGDAIEKARDARDAINNKGAEYKAGWKLLNEALADLEGEVCPTCQTSLAEGSASKRIKAKQGERRRLRAKIDALVEERNECNVEISGLEKQARESREAQAELSSIDRKLRTEERALAEKERVQESLARDIKDMLEKAKAHLVRAKEIAGEQNPHADVYKEARAKEKKKKAELEVQREERAEQEVMLAHIQFWAKGFSNKGLPSFILDSVMPMLTESANEYLETLADGDITLDFRTQRELKDNSGDVRDDITIIPTIEGHEGVTPSTGQRTKMNVATDLALMDLSTRREGANLDLLMLDEVLDGLDDEGSERVLMLLQQLRQKRGSIFVVSHGQNMAEIFEHGLRVVKEGGSATIERIA